MSGRPQQRPGRASCMRQLRRRLVTGLALLLLAQSQAAVDALKEPTSLLEKAWLQRDVVATLQGVRSSADPLSRPVRASTAEQHHSTKHFPGRNVEQGHSSRLAHNDGKTSQPESPRRGQVGSPSAAWQHVLRQQASLRRSHRIGGRRVSKAARALLQQGRPRGPWLKLHRLFTDGVVISQDDGIIGGFANEGARVLVTLTGSGEDESRLMAQQMAKADAKGRWWVSLGPLPPGGPLRLTASLRGGTTVVVEGVLIGLVWLIAGQSNIVFSLADAVRSGAQPWALKAQQTIAAADSPAGRSLPVRLFEVPMSRSRWEYSNLAEHGTLHLGRHDDITGSGAWRPLSGEVAQQLSAVAVLTAKRLAGALPDTPIGIIQVAEGGTSIMEWLPDDDVEAVRAQLPAPDPHFPPSALWNGAVAPLAGMLHLAGIVWYQGETDAGITATFQPWTLYQQLLGRLMQSWRRNLQLLPRTPFTIVQLPPYRSRYRPEDDPQPQFGLNHWPAVREAQRQAVLNNGPADLVCLLDLGDGLQVHPPNKVTVADRVAAALLHQLGRGDQPWIGPTLAEAEFSADGGALLRFEGVGEGLRRAAHTEEAASARELPRGGPLGCFELRGGDGVWRPAAEAVIVPAASVRLRASTGAAGVAAPQRATGVRMAWADAPTGCLLTGSHHLPAVPFVYEQGL